MIYLRIECGFCRRHSEEGFETQLVKESKGKLVRVGSPQYVCEECWRRALSLLRKEMKDELD